MNPVVATVIITFFGSLVHTSIGFGNGLFIMNFLPMVLPYPKAAATMQVCSFFLMLSVWVRCVKYIRWDVLLPISLPAMLMTFLCTKFSLGLDTAVLKMALGVLFIALSIYFYILSGKIAIKPNPRVGLVTGFIAGTFNGFFGIGGPPAALYLTPALPTNQEYIATTQFYFFMNTVVALSVRLTSGVLDKGDTPYLVYGVVAAVLGALLGYQFVTKVNREALKKLIYAFIGLNGLVIVLQYFLGA